MKRNAWLLLWLGAWSVSFAAPQPPVIHPTDFILVNGTGAKLVQPTLYPLIPTTHGSLILQTDAVFIPTTEPLLNPLAQPLVPKGM